MNWLNKQTVIDHLSMPAAIEAIEQLLHVQTNHPSWIKAPERLVIKTFSEDMLADTEHNEDKPSSGSHLSMPATIYDGENEYATVKLVTICPDNPSRKLPTTTALITVSNNATGAILAVMDGIYITQVRTGALSAIATKHMAKQQCETVAVIGCGGMAYEQLNAVLTVRPTIKKVYLWNRDTKRAEQFKQRFSEDYSQWDLELDVCEHIDKAIKNADIINVATRATQGLFSAEHIKPDVHINAVGAYQPSMKEISNEVIAASSMVIVDDKAGSRHEAGDLIQADEASDCPWSWDDLSGDLQGLITTGAEKIDKNSAGITLFKSVGAASFDAAVALYLAKQSQAQNIGVCLS